MIRAALRQRLDMVKMAILARANRRFAVGAFMFLRFQNFYQIVCCEISRRAAPSRAILLLDGCVSLRVVKLPLLSAVSCFLTRFLRRISMKSRICFVCILTFTTSASTVIRRISSMPLLGQSLPSCGPILPCRRTASPIPMSLAAINVTQLILARLRACSFFAVRLIKHILTAHLARKFPAPHSFIVRQFSQVRFTLLGPPRRAALNANVPDRRFPFPKMAVAQKLYAHFCQPTAYRARIDAVQRRNLSRRFLFRDIKTFEGGFVGLLFHGLILA